MTDEHEPFEAHMRSLNPCVRLARQKSYLGGRYRTVTVQRAWELWQAARADQSAREAAVMAVLREFSALYGHLWDLAEPEGAGYLSPQSVAKYDAIHVKAHALLYPEEVQP